MEQNIENNNICLIKIYLEEGYKWGYGWTDMENSNNFDKKITSLSKIIHEDLLTPDLDGACMEIRNSYNLELYCYPMYISGYCKVEDVDKIIQGCKKVGLNITEISYDPKQNLQDEATVVISFFTEKYKEIVKFIKGLSRKKFPIYNIKGYVWEKYRVPTKENHCGWSDFQPTKIALDKIVDECLSKNNKEEK